MAKPLHIGSSKLKVERSTFTFPLFLSSVICFLSSAPHNYEAIMQNKPNLWEAQMDVTSLLLTTKDQRLMTREVQNKPKQTQFSLYMPPRKAIMLIRKPHGQASCTFGEIWLLCSQQRFIIRDSKVI